MDGPPPPRDSAVLRRRDKLLELCLPKTAKGLQRRSALQEVFTSDLTCHEICIYRPGGARHDGDEFLQEWAEKACTLLFPCRLELFSRSRWMTSLEPFTLCTLLSNFHNVLERAVRVWIPSKA